MDLYKDEKLPMTFALFELPGISENALKVDVSRNTLTVQGARDPPLRYRLNQTLRSASPARETGESREFSLLDAKYASRELNHGCFFRQVKLPSGIEVRPYTMFCCSVLTLTLIVSTGFSRPLQSSGWDAFGDLASSAEPCHRRASIRTRSIRPSSGPTP